MTKSVEGKAKVVTEITSEEIRQFLDDYKKELFGGVNSGISKKLLFQINYSIVLPVLIVSALSSPALITILNSNIGSQNIILYTGLLMLLIIFGSVLLSFPLYNKSLEAEKEYIKLHKQVLKDNKTTNPNIVVALEEMPIFSINTINDLILTLETLLADYGDETFGLTDGSFSSNEESMADVKSRYFSLDRIVIIKDSKPLLIKTLFKGGKVVSVDTFDSAYVIQQNINTSHTEKD